MYTRSSLKHTAVSKTHPVFFKILAQWVPDILGNALKTFDWMCEKIYHLEHCSVHLLGFVLCYL